MAAEDGPQQEPELAMAAAAAAGDNASLWARHARTDIQASHSLTEPLARWAPEPIEPPIDLELGATDHPPEFAIPEKVLLARPPQRLPEDTICRSPIAGMVIAVMAAPGQRIALHEPVLVIEAMKMQNDVSANVDGVVKSIHVVPGDAVKSGQVLFELA
jgi:biotin carboxyl carrier protein